MFDDETYVLCIMLSFENFAATIWFDFVASSLMDARSLEDCPSCYPEQRPGSSECEFWCIAGIRIFLPGQPSRCPCPEYKKCSLDPLIVEPHSKTSTDYMS